MRRHLHTIPQRSQSSLGFERAQSCAEGREARGGWWLRRHGRLVAAAPRGRLVRLRLQVCGDAAAPPPRGRLAVWLLKRLRSSPSLAPLFFRFGFVAAQVVAAYPLFSPS